MEGMEQKVRTLNEKHFNARTGEKEDIVRKRE